MDYAQSHGNSRAAGSRAIPKLLVKQMRGQYKVKSEDLRPRFSSAPQKKCPRPSIPSAIEHVYREQNREADAALPNEALG